MRRIHTGIKFVRKKRIFCACILRFAAQEELRNVKHLVLGACDNPKPSFLDIVFIRHRDEMTLRDPMRCGIVTVDSLCARQASVVE